MCTQIWADSCWHKQVNSSPNKTLLLYLLCDGAFFLTFEKSCTTISNNRFLWFFFQKKSFLKGFFLKRLWFGAESSKLYFKRFVLKGVGYKILSELSVDNKVIICFDLGFTHYWITHVPSCIKIFTKKSSFVLFGANKFAIDLFSKFLLSLRKRDVYKGKGLSILGFTYFYKVGKRR